MRAKLLGSLLIAGLLLAGCGGGRNDNPALGGPQPAPSSPPASASPPPAGAGACPASAGLPANAADHGAKAATGPAEKLIAGDFFFEPTCLTQLPAGTVTLTVANSGGALHNFSLPDQGLDQDVEPGKQITVTIRVGTTALPYFCKYHRTSGMVGALLPVQR